MPLKETVISVKYAAIIKLLYDLNNLTAVREHRYRCVFCRPFQVFLISET